MTLKKQANIKTATRVAVLFLSSLSVSLLRVVSVCGWVQWRPAV